MQILLTDGTVLTFDTSDEEVIDTSSTVTEHPIEGGGNVADHVILNSTRIRLRATVSNTPIKEPASLMRGVTGSVSSLNLGENERKTLKQGAQLRNPAQYEELRESLSANVLQFDGEFDRVFDMYATLVEIQTTFAEFQVATPLNIWENCLLESLSAPRDAESGSAVEFSMEVVSVVFADSQTVSAPEAQEPAGQRTRSRGSQNSEEADSTDNQSFARRYVNWVNS